LVVRVDAGWGQLQSTREVLEPVWMRLPFSNKSILLHSSLSAITLHGLSNYSMNIDIIHDTLLSANNSRMPLLINLKIRILIDPLLGRPLLLNSNLLLYFSDDSFLIDFELDGPPDIDDSPAGLSEPNHCLPGSRLIAPIRLPSHPECLGPLIELLIY
jgi:hypothetical protein